jgi:hypothetical protein
MPDFVLSFCPELRKRIRGVQSFNLSCAVCGFQTHIILAFIPFILGEPREIPLANIEF